MIKPPPPPEVRDGPEPVLPPPKGTTALDRLAIAGRLDFTAAASGPLNLRGQNPWEAIRHEVIAYPRGASFQPKNFYRRIEQIAGGEVRLVNGTIIFQDLTGRYGDDQLNLRAARLPVAGLPKVQRWREISGTATFHPPLQRYTPKLDKILDTLNPSGPFLIAGSWTNDRTGQVVKKDYDLIISSDTGSFTLTDRQIELANIHGDATVVPAGVDLRGVTAKVLGGDVEVSGRWLNGEPYNPTSPATYEADVTLRNLDVAKLENQLVDEPPRKPLRGKIFCDGTISGATAKAWTKQQKLHSLGGDGQLEVVDGSLLQIPVLRALTQNIKGIEDTANMGDAAAFFTIADGKIRLRDAAVNSAVLGLQGGGTIGLDGTLDLDIVAAPLADWRERLAATKIPIVSDVFAEVVGGVQKLLNTATGTLLYEFRVDGPAKAARLTAVPTPVLTDTAAFVFGKMLSPPKKDQRPLDYLHRAEQGRAAQHPPPQGQAEPRADTSRDREPATR